jgi:hypothetical protein
MIKENARVLLGRGADIRKSGQLLPLSIVVILFSVGVCVLRLALLLLRLRPFFGVVVVLC